MIRWRSIVVANQRRYSMKRRLEQLAEDSRPFKDDPKAGGRDSNPLIEEMYNRIKNQENTHNPYTRELGYIRAPKGTSKEIMDDVSGDIWTGEEAPQRVAQRLAMDKARLKMELPKQRKVPVHERISEARDKTLNYKLGGGKDQDQDHQESGPSIKDQYIEKFMMASGASDALTSIQSIASKRIEDAIERGQFKDIKRGVDANKEKDHLASSPYIDTTEYYLNSLIKRQGAQPPWIERQTQLYDAIKHMRRTLINDWEKRAVSVLDSSTRGLRKQDRLGAAEKLSRDEEWERKQRKYHELLVSDVNNVIRSYNLHAPQTARKGYVDLESELNLCYANANVVRAFRNHIDAPPPPKIEELQKKAGSDIPRANIEHYGVGALVRDLFRRRVPK